jgi:hypothetical protein
MRRHPVVSNVTANAPTSSNEQAISRQQIDTQQQKNCWMRCFPRGPCRGHIMRTPAVAESAQDYQRKGVLFQPNHLRTIVSGGAMQQDTATVAASAALCFTGLHSHSGRNECPSLPWGTTYKSYPVSQFRRFRLLMQTVRLWTCSQ